MTLFAPTEYAGRLARTRERMTTSGIELLVVVDPANMNYLTGYDGWSFYTPQAVLVPADPGEDPIWVGREQDAPTAHATTWLSEDHIRPYAERYIGSPDLHPMQALGEVIAEHGWHRGRIGVETDAYYYTARWDAILRHSLPEADLVDAYLLVNRVRAVKSEAEIALMRNAARLTGHAMRAALGMLRPGLTQTDLLGEVLRAEIAGVDGIAGDYPSSRVHVAAGEWTDQPHAPFRNAPFPEVGVVTLELGATHCRYDAPLARTAYLGTPPAGLVRLAGVVRDGLEAALDAVRPGVTCEDVEAAWRRTIAAAGYEKASRIGYSIGVGYPPTRIENTMSLRQGDLTVLQPNMTFHLIPGMWLSGYGYELSETFRVTGSGVEVLTDFPRELIVKA